MRIVVILAVSLVLLIWAVTGGIHWGTAALLSSLGVLGGIGVTLLGCKGVQQKIVAHGWGEFLSIRRFRGVGALGWMLLCMMAMTVFSLIPLPLGMLEILSPHAASVYREAWALVGLDHDWGRLTVDPGRTSFALWMLVGFFGIYLCTVRMAGTRRRMTGLSHLFVILGCLFVAMMGLRFVGYPIDFGELGALSPWHIGLPVNLNHLSSLMVGLSLMALGAMLTKKHRNVYGRRALWGFLYLIFSVAMIMLKSRGAILAWGLGHLCFIGLYFAAIHQVKWKMGVAALGGMSIVLAASLIVSAPTVGQIAQEYEETEIVFDVSDDQRFVDETPQTMSKTQLYGDFFPMMQDWGLTGIGRSAFHDVYPAYQSFPFHKRFRHVENEYLEIVLEYGWIGGLLCLILGTIGILSFIRMCARESKEAKLALGYLAAVIAILIQNCFDFGLRYWTVGMLFWLFCGILEARRQRWRYDRIEKDTAPALAQHQWAHGIALSIWGIAVISCLATAALAVDGQTESGMHQLRRTPSMSQAAANMTVRPRSPEVRKLMGFAALDASEGKNTTEQHEHWQNARRWLESAYLKAPRDGRTSLHLGKTCLALNDLDCALLHFQNAVHNDPKLRTLAMYEIAGLPTNQLQLPDTPDLRWAMIQALNHRLRFDAAFELIDTLQQDEYAVEHAKLMCSVYASVGFTEGCDAIVERLGDLPLTLDLFLLKTEYMIRHQDWETLFNLYDNAEHRFKDLREYWRKRLYHSVFYGKHRAPEWYHDAVPAIFLRYRHVSDGDKQWRFDDAYCGAFYALEMQQLSRAIRDAKTALAIRPNHKGSATILKEAEKRQKNHF